MSGRVPRHDLDTEQAVLASVLIEAGCLDEVLDVLPTAAPFYGPANRYVFQAMLDLAAAGLPINSVSVAERLKDSSRLAQVGGIAWLMVLVESTPAVVDVRVHAERLRALHTVRELGSVCQQVLAESYSDQGPIPEWLDRSEQAVFAVVHNATAPASMASGLDALEEAIAEVQAAGEGGVGTPTGFRSVDAYTSGYHPGELTILAARPGIGKTAYAARSAWNVVLEDRGEERAGVVFFSCEMPRTQLSLRMALAEHRLSLSELRAGRVTGEHGFALDSARDMLRRAPIWIDEAPSPTVLEVRAKVRRLQAECARGPGPDGKRRQVRLVVVDYLQLLRGSGNADGRTQEVSEIARGLKNLAKELKVHVMALSQLNRSVETRADKRPMLSDLRESGEIEAAADVVIGLYRDEYYNEDSVEHGVAEALILKQRNGQTGTVRLAFQGDCMRFDDLAHGERPC